MRDASARPALLTHHRRLAAGARAAASGLTDRAPPTAAVCVSASEARGVDSGVDADVLDVNRLTSRLHAFPTSGLPHSAAHTGHQCTARTAARAPRCCVNTDFFLSSVMRISLNHGKMVAKTTPRGSPSATFGAADFLTGTLMR